MKNAWFLGCMLLVMTACDSQTVYKEYTDIDDGKWTIKNTPSFTFRIDDPTIPYNIYYNLRNSISYP
ncbi:MAG: gliding motility lipoprotein GldH, partial [Bacteroidetes bacterium]|nr:gliding motility lipoprotein GldH [Fibrella sp.]